MSVITKQFVIVTVVGAAIFTVVSLYVTSKVQAKTIGDGVKQPDTSGSNWSGVQNYPLNNNAEAAVYAVAPGRQGNRTSFNGQIFTDRFKKGNNHNAVNNVEGSGGCYAFQTSTKNPFANGTYSGYADAVDAATQDPTNQVTSLVLGPGVAPND